MEPTVSLEQETLESEEAAEPPLLTFFSSSRSRAFLKHFYPNVTLAEWNDWHWQLKNCITDVQALSRVITLSPAECSKPDIHPHNLPLRITPYYASLLDRENPAHPLRRSVVPTQDEFVFSPGESRDPLCEDDHSPVPGLVHRYPDRALFLVTGTCSTFCRYCTRSRMVGKRDNVSYNPSRWSAAIDYIQAHPEVRDVLVSGGDPLTLSDDALESIVQRLRRIRHVEMIRIGTKMPVALPQRITSSLVSMLKKYHPLWMSIHVTHPEELTPECEAACARLADAGIPLGSQTVLLKGVNDSISPLKNLMHGLIKFRVKPYYLYQCDPIPGSSHFRTPVSKGLEMIQGLRGHTSGYAVPTFAIDAPGGGGKIPLLPEYVIGRDENGIILRNYEGKIFHYPDRE
ncbi:MAG: KamA family radical SAM protein [Deltaproteobacteria bacterium]|nr:KamA family radical SAM protein [Deltaproteobacteria bacterium]